MEPIVEKAPMNDNGSKPIVARSKFDYNYNLAGTYRFGEIGVASVQDTIPDSDVPLYSAHDVRSFNLKAPLLGNIKLHKEFFDVPFPVLLPKNYEKVFTQPSIGEDIDASEVGLNVKDFDLRLCRVFQGWFEELQAYSDSPEHFASALKFFLCGERFYSKGCLLSALGVQLGSTFQFVRTDGDGVQINYSFDYMFDSFFKSFFAALRVSDTTLRIDGKDFVFTQDGKSESNITNYRLLELMRDASTITITNGDGSLVLPEPFVEDSEFSIVFSVALNTPSGGAKPISLARPEAYQVVCAEFFTNSHVDYMYSAQLYRQFVMDFYESTSMFDNGVSRNFILNGVSYEYDFLSAHYAGSFMDYCYDILGTGSCLDIDSYFLDWSRLLFGYNRSLRYVDYFTGSRTRPLAVGNVDVQVRDGFVNVVEAIEKRWTAKFLNQVNRVQRKLSDYMRALFPNLTLQRDAHDPMWLAAIEDYINSPEVESNVFEENSTEQNTTTSVLRSNGERYAFEYHTQYYGVAIGVLYFDIKRYYTDIIERPNFFVDRNDYFNPYLQFTGDQKVYGDEINARNYHTTIFGYQGSYMEYKQRVDQCFGGFSEAGILPGWLFIANQVDEEESISPDYIRSRCSELDPFFSSLTRLDLAGYWHFIIVNKNVSPLMAPMVKNPQLD